MVRDLEDLQARSNGALEKWKLAQAKIAERDSLPAAGDLYVFSATAEIGLEWAVILPHVDDTNLWFIVPFDQNSMAGTWDVAVSESSEAGAGTLRCGRGIWIHVDDLVIGARSGFLETYYVDKARSRLAELVDPNRDVVKTRPEIDFNPDYVEWMDEVTAAAERLEAELRAEPEVISVAVFSTAWTSALPSRSFQAAHGAMLVAESSGLAALPTSQIPALPGYLMAQELPGTLVAIRDGALIRLLYYPAKTEDAPAVVFFSGDDVKSVNWQLQLDGVSISTDEFSAENTILRLPDGTKKLLCNRL